jgi:3,4-dihydroxy 2-butanone 4-phosphate synthase/GTP cyclohydrolase II
VTGAVQAAAIRRRIRIPLRFADGYSTTATVVTFNGLADAQQHVALELGRPATARLPLVRLHSECLTGDVFGSRRCDCGAQLSAAMTTIAAAGMGVVVYLRGHEGRGIGITHKLRAYELQDSGLDTVDANVELGLPVDSREYGIGAQILVDLGITTMRLMTNNPAKRGGLEGYGLQIVGRVPLHTVPNAENIRYLQTKRDRMGHLMAADEETSGRGEQL